MEQKLLTLVYEKYHRELYLYIYSLSRNHHIAEDLTQETFLKALLSLPEEHGNIRAWLYMVARNLFFNYREKASRNVSLEEEMKAVAGNLYITTDDGSYGRHGMVTKVIEDLVAEGKTYTKCVSIGPMIMMKFCCLTTQKLGIPTIVSMNPIMVDGTGMCGACRVIVGDEVKFACVDGPEFDGHLIDWNLAMQRQQMYKTEEGRALLKQREGDTHHGGCGNCGGDK